MKINLSRLDYNQFTISFTTWNIRLTFKSQQGEISRDKKSANKKIA